MRARQEISRTKIAIVDLKGKRDSEISTEMQKTQARLDELKSRMETSSNLLYETEVLAPQDLATADGRPVEPVFKIVKTRQCLYGVVEVVSQEQVVMPGDTIVVEMPPRQFPQMRVDARLPTSEAAPAVAPTASVDIPAPGTPLSPTSL